MKSKIISIFLLFTLIVPTKSAYAGQLQDDLEALSVKLTPIVQEGMSFAETMADLELSVDIATDDKDVDELKKLINTIIELIEKQENLEKAFPPLKKSLDDYCAKARSDKSDTADAIDGLVACEDVESLYNAYTNSTKSFKESRRNIEANLAKFDLNLTKPKPTPTPTPKPSEPAKPSPAPSMKAPTSKKVTIKCVKGKTIKKVTAVNPKCPVGFKKR